MVELEVDQLNEHECMASLTALLRYMQKTGILPDPSKSKVSLVSISFQP